jgi:hypothetical protein
MAAFIQKGSSFQGIASGGTFRNDPEKDFKNRYRGKNSKSF